MSDYAGLLDAVFAAGQAAGVLLLVYGGWLSATAWQYRLGPVAANAGNAAVPVSIAQLTSRDVPATVPEIAAVLHDEPAHSLSTTA